MTTPAQVLDRNEAFNTERGTQIAAILAYNKAYPERVAAAKQAAADYQAGIEQRIADGKLIPVGNGRYRVNEPGSYDDGEVLSMQSPRIPRVSMMLMPEHGLDMSTGEAALYTRHPEWHTLGHVVPEGLTDIGQVLEAGGIAWEVGQTEALYRRPAHRHPVTGEVIPESVVTAPGKFVNFREDTGDCLGVVGKVYNPFQQRVAAMFLQDLVQKYNIVFESAGATFSGAHVFIGMKLADEDLVLDLGDGVTDIIKQYLYWWNSHDGSGKARVTVSPWRIACGNTERFNLRDAKATWGVAHTTNALNEENLREARRTLNLTMGYYKAFRVEEEALARTNLVIADFEEVMAVAYPRPGKDAKEGERKIWDERAGVMTSMWRAESERLGRTAYAAERVITDFADNVVPRRHKDGMDAARATALIEGTEDERKSRVHAKLLTLASR